MTRRGLLTAGAVASAGLLLPGGRPAHAAGRKVEVFGDVRFQDGVMSGDPTPNTIRLWTRVDGAERAGKVSLEVAADAGFSEIVHRRSVAADARRDYTVHARIDGLDAHSRYYYRFATRDGSSPVGQFTTALPPDSEQPVRFAYFSCQDWAHGFYNAHELLAKEDVDFVVCLGDYIYAESFEGIYASEGNILTGIHPVRHDTVGTARTLAQYRRKYRLHRSDPVLQAMHQRFPMISLWDDHEVSNDYFGGPPTSKRYAKSHHDAARRRAGYRAFFEYMPTAPVGGSGTRLYRSMRFGRSVDLLLIDERQYRAEQPCHDDVAAAPCLDINKPRTFLGRKQMDFVKERLQLAGGTWKVIANEVMIMPARLTPGTHYGFDGWTGYQRERTELLRHIARHNVENVVFVTGDIHMFLAGEVWQDSGLDGSGRPIPASRRRPLATEFVGGSITSATLGEFTVSLNGSELIKGNDEAPQTPPAITELLRRANPWIHEADFDHHGYGLVAATPNELTVTFRRVDTIKRHGAVQALPDLSWTLRSGEPGLG